MKRFTLILSLLVAMVTTAMGQSSLRVSEPSLPGTLTGGQYHWTSDVLTAPTEGEFNRLRITFLQNSHNGWPSGFPHVAIAEFYLYDKDDNRVELTENQFSSNATQSDEGAISELCDGNTTQQEGEGQWSWYWHSQWSGEPTPYGYHYLEIDLSGVEADLSKYKIGWVTRQSDGSPTEIVISAGETSNKACENANKEMLPKLSTGGKSSFYTIKSVRSKKYLTYTCNNVEPVQQSNITRNSYWYFTEGTDGKVVMHNVATEQVLGDISGNGKIINMQDSGEWNILPSPYRPGSVIAKDASNLNGNCIDEQDSHTGIGSWGHNAGDNEGTSWLIEEIDVDFAVTELHNKKISAVGEPVTEVVEGKWYILNNAGRGNYVSQEVNNWKMRATSSLAVGNSAETKAGYLFKITKNGEHYNIMSGNGRYFKLGRNSAATSKTPVNFDIALIGETNNFYLFDADNKYAADGQETDNSFVGWSTTPPGSAGGNDSYKLLPVELETGIEYVYDYYLNNTKIATETLVSENFADLSNYYKVSSTNIPTGTAKKGTYRVDITDDEDFPFEYSSSLENATNWYFLQMHCNFPSWIQDNGSGVYPYENPNTVANDDTRYKFAWAFVGDPINGFKVINNVTRKAIKSNGSGDAVPADVANATKWLVKPSAVKSEAEYFALKYPTGVNYLNANGTNKKLQHWEQADGGSTIKLELLEDVYQYEITDMAENVYSGEYTYRGNAGSLTGAYGHELTDVELNIAERTYTANINFHYPVSKIGGATNEILLSQFGDSKFWHAYNNNVKVQTTGVASIDSNCYWAIYPSYNNGAFTFSIMNTATGKYIHTDATNGAHNTEGTIVLSETPTMFVINSEKDWKVADKNLYLSINSDSDTDVFLGLYGGVHNGTNVSNVAITEYKATITAAKYATFYAPVAVTVPEGVTAHTLEIVGNWVVTSEPLATIPAYTGVILYSETPNTYTFAVATDFNNEGVDSGALSGTVATTYITDEAYVLQAPNGDVTKLGFYLAPFDKLDGTAFKSNHHKAFLRKPVNEPGLASYAIRNDFDGTTAIEDVDAEEAEEKVVYDLQGRKVENPTKGIYIINGNKVLVK